MLVKATRIGPAIFLLLWSAGFAFVKIGLTHAAPLTFLAVRYALVLIVLTPLVVVLRPPPPKTAAAWGHLVAVGLLIQVLYFGLSFVAIGRGVSAGTVALIVSLQPILVALLAPRLTGEQVSARRWAGLGLGLLGAALVIGSRSVVAATSVLGLICAAGALLGITMGTLYEKRFGIAQHPVTANVVQYAVGFVATLPAAWALENLRMTWTGDFVALAYLVVGNSLISLTLLLAMIRRGEAARVSALFFLVPPVAAVFAWALIGEAMPPPAWAGLALAATGVGVASSSTRRARRS